MELQLCELCGVQQGTGWCSTCCRQADAKAERKHQQEVKRTRPEGLGAGRKIGRRPSLDDYDNR